MECFRPAGSRMESGISIDALNDQTAAHSLHKYYLRICPLWFSIAGIVIRRVFRKQTEQILIFFGYMHTKNVNCDIMVHNQSETARFLDLLPPMGTSGSERQLALLGFIGEEK